MIRATTPLRVLPAAVGLTALLAVLVLAWETVRFGTTADATAARVEREVRAVVDERVRQVERLATAVEAESRLVQSAADTPSELPQLFERLRALAADNRGAPVAVTVYASEEGRGTYRILAWTDGPGERNLSAERLAGPAALFVAPGHAGLRLIKVEPISREDRTAAVVVAETVLAPIDRRSAAATPSLATAYGNVSVIAQYAGAREGSSSTFSVLTAAGDPLLEAHVAPEELTAARGRFRRRGLAAAMAPLACAVALLASVPLARRRRTASATTWWLWTLLAVVVMTAAAAVLAALAMWAGAALAFAWALGSLLAVGVVAITVGQLWWRPCRRRSWARHPWRFVLEHVLAGGTLLAAIVMVTRLHAGMPPEDVLSLSQSVLFPFAADAGLTLVAVLLTQVALGWSAFSILALAAGRWRVWPVGLPTLAAVLCWLLPLAAWPLVVVPPLDRWGLATMLGMAVPAAVLARPARHRYRHATPSMRLGVAFAVLAAPCLAMYPVSIRATETASRRLVADEYAPALARHPQEQRQELARAQADLDRMASLEAMVREKSEAATAGSGRPDSRPAFLVWSQSSLARSRVISSVELFDADRGLISRFAFNLPEYVYRTAAQTRQGAGCQWDVFGEATQVGAEARLMLHAERGICDATGRPLGGVVLHVASHDYQALPFVSMPSPFDEVATDTRLARRRVPDLRVAVYGWSQRPIFTSGDVAWPLPQATFDELYRSGGPIWRDVVVGDRTFEVHYSQSRSGVYAVGFPRATQVAHATRLAEITVLMAGVFLLLQLGALVYAFGTQAGPAPVRLLVQEARTSFYRKLFLSFVAVAVVPVVVAAGAVGAYVTDRFQADVEREAAATARIAQRVLEEIEAADGRADTSASPNDDAMVWIRQVTDEDVNYFEGAELVATSRRDLFDSGLLPVRTPAAVYRGIALERQPTLVTEERLAGFEYVLAAAPVTSRGAQAILTVPLAPRQRELARELETLNQRVLVGAVLVVIFAAALGSSLAGRVADPVSRITRATRQIAAGNLDVRIASESADELRTLVNDFNSMAATLDEQRAALARTNQIKAWNEMARQVAHEIKNPLTPIQLAAEHLQQVNEDRQRPLGSVLDQCVGTILTQVRLLRRIASEFANFSSEPVSRPTAIDPATLVADVIGPYRAGAAGRVTFTLAVPASLPPVWADRTLLVRAFTNLTENAIQAMPSGGTLRISARQSSARTLSVVFADNGPGMDEPTLARAFEPFFSTKSGGSGLGLVNAKRGIEREGGTITITSALGAGTTVTMELPLAVGPRGAGGAG